MPFNGARAILNLVLKKARSVQAVFCIPIILAAIAFQQQCLLFCVVISHKLKQWATVNIASIDKQSLLNKHSYSQKSQCTVDSDHSNMQHSNNKANNAKQSRVNNSKQTITKQTITKQPITQQEIAQKTIGSQNSKCNQMKPTLAHKVS